MNHYKILRNTILIVILSFTCGAHIMAQEDSTPVKKLKTYMYLDYFKKSDGSKHLVATAKAKINKKFVLLNDLPIVFEIETDTSVNVLGTINTNEAGEAIYIIDSNENLASDDEGIYIFVASFKGSKEQKPKKKDVEVKDLNMIVKLEIVDSAKTILIEANELLNDSITPVEDLDVIVYVQRMFSLLEVGEGTIENGIAEIIFPDDIPGDSIGNLEILTMVEDDRDFGNVENIQFADWGIPVTERESYKSSFSAGSYIMFMLISGLIAILIVFFASKKKSKVNKPV